MTIPIDYLWGIGFARQQGGGGDSAKIQALLDDAEERVVQLRNEMAWGSFDSYNIGKAREKELRNQGNKRLRDQIVSGKASKYGRLDVEGWLEPYYQTGRAQGRGQFDPPGQDGIDVDIENDPATKEIVGLLAAEIKEKKLVPTSKASARINEKLFRAYDAEDLIPNDKKLSLPYRGGYMLRGIKLSDHIQIYDLANVVEDPNYVEPEADVFAGLVEFDEPADEPEVRQDALLQFAVADLAPTPDRVNFINAINDAKDAHDSGTDGEVSDFELDEAASQARFFDGLVDDAVDRSDSDGEDPFGWTNSSYAEERL